MAAVDIYLNETTRHADVILPPTTVLERDHYDIVFHGLAVRNTARFTPAVFDKPRGARHDWEIFRDLALRICERARPQPPLRSRLQQRPRLLPSPRSSIGLLLRRGRRTTSRELRKHPEGVDLGPLRPTLPDRLRRRTSGSTWRRRWSLADLRPAARDAGRGRRRRGCCSSAAATSATTTRGCTTPTG